MGQSSECQSNLAQLSGFEKDQFIEVLFNSSPDMIVFLKVDFTIRMANRAFISQIGLTEEQIVGSSGKAVLPGLHKQLDYLFQKSLLTKQPARSKFNFQLTGSNGRVASYWKVYVNPLFEADEFTGWLMVFKETTKHVLDGIKRAEESQELKRRVEKLQSSEKILLAINSLIPFGLWECNLEGEIIEANEPFLLTSGLALEECRGWGWVSLLAETDRQGVLEGWKACFNRESEWQYCFELRCQTGEYRKIAAKGYPVRNREGLILSWMVLNLDVTDLQAASPAPDNGELQLWQQLFTSIISYAPIALAMYAGGDMSLRWATPLYQRFLETSEQAREKAGIILENHLPYTGALRFDEIFYQVITEGIPSLDLPVRFDAMTDEVWRCSVVPMSGSGENSPDIMVIAVNQAFSEQGVSALEPEAETFTELIPASPEHGGAETPLSQSILDNLTEGLMVFNGQGELVQINRYARALLGGAQNRDGGLDDWNAAIAENPVEYYGPDGTRLEWGDWPEQKVFRGERLDKVDLEVRRPYWSDHRFLSFNGTLIEDETAQQRLAVLTFRDITDRKVLALEKEHRSLENSRQKEFLESLLETTSFGIAVVRGPEYRFDLVNRHYQKIPGIPEALVNQRLVDVFPEETVAKMTRVLDKVKQSGCSVKVAECENIKRVGLGDQYLEYEYLPLKSGVGDEADSILIVTTDVSEGVLHRKRAEYLTAIMSELNNATTMTDILKTAVHCMVQAMNANDGAIYLFNEEDGELQGVYELWLDEGAKRSIVVHEMPNTKIAVDSQTPVYFTAEAAAGKEKSWFQQTGMAGCMAVPLVLNKQCIGLVFLFYVWRDLALVEGDREFAALIAEKCALVIDRANTQMEKTRLLTSERRARSHAERQAAQMSALLQSLKEGVLVLDASGNIVLRNRMERSISKVEDSQALSIANYGRFRLLQPDGAPLPSHLLPGSRLLRGEPLNDTEYIMEYPDGSRKYVISNGSVVRGEDGQVVLGILVTRDVSQMRILESAREDFIRAVSHDLRNPLTVVSARSQMLVRRLMKQGLKGESEEVEVIYVNARRMTQMIQEMFDSYRMESSNLKLSKTLIDLAQVVQDLGLRIGTEEDQKRIRFEIARGSYRIHGDRERLDRAFINLISNALKYSPSDKPVVVRMVSDADCITVMVTDYGIGIAPQDLPRVFQRYYRSDSVKDSAGLGLGLYIVKLIIEAHGGTVKVESAPNQGSTFYVSLPFVVDSDIN